MIEPGCPQLLCGSMGKILVVNSDKLEIWPTDTTLPHTDSDDQNDYAESYITETNPTNAASYFHIHTATTDAGNAVLSWSNTANRVVRALCTQDLLSNTWNQVATFSNSKFGS